MWEVSLVWGDVLIAQLPSLALAELFEQLWTEETGDSLVIRAPEKEYCGELGYEVRASDEPEPVGTFKEAAQAVVFATHLAERMPNPRAVSVRGSF